MKCQRCGTEFDGNYCPVCGEWLKRDARPATPKSELPAGFRAERAVIIKPFYTRNWFIVLMLFCFFPAGLFLMWRYQKFTPGTRAVITALLCICLVTGILAFESLKIHGSLYIASELPEYPSVSPLPEAVQNAKTREKNTASAFPEGESKAEKADAFLLFLRCTAIARDETGRYAGGIQYPLGPEDWTITQNDDGTTTIRAQVSSGGKKKTLTVSVTLQEERKSYETHRITLDEETLFDEEDFY